MSYYRTLDTHLLGAWLRSHRGRKTYEEVGKASGIHSRVYSRLEKGGTPSCNQLIQLADWMDIDITYFIKPAEQEDVT